MDYNEAIRILKIKNHTVEAPHITASGKVRMWVDGVSVSIGWLGDLAEGKVTVEELDTTRILSS